MSPESSDPVRTHRTGHVSGLVPTPRHKDQPGRRARKRARREAQKPRDPVKPEPPEDEQPADADADDEHEVDYLA
jgi:hypothetical protein